MNEMWANETNSSSSKNNVIEKDNEVNGVCCWIVVQNTFVQSFRMDFCFVFVHLNGRNGIWHNFRLNYFTLSLYLSTDRITVVSIVFTSFLQFSTQDFRSQPNESALLTLLSCSHVVDGFKKELHEANYSEWILHSLRHHSIQ